MNDQIFFASCARGLEDVVARELKVLKAKKLLIHPGGVEFQGDFKIGYKANLWLRSAIRVLWRLTEFDIKKEDDLYDQIVEIPWEEYFSIDHTLAVTSSVRDSLFTHSKYLALKTKDAIVDRFRNKYERRPSVDKKNPDVIINVFLGNNHCILSFDMSGQSLHQRGYRQKGGEAPLKEALAAGIIMLTGYDGTQPLVDGMCGSGTLAIEAALIARNHAPGLLRNEFGFERWPRFEEKTWQKIVEDAQEKALRKTDAPVFASDISEEAVNIAKENALHAGIRPSIKFSVRKMQDITPRSDSGIILCNPPYGERLGEIEALSTLYAEIGDLYKNSFKGYTGFVFTGNLELLKKIGLKTSRRFELFNGAIDCRLAQYQLY